MAYMNQEKKKVIAAMLKTALKGKNVKYTLSVRENMDLYCKISAGCAGLKIHSDERGYHNVSEYHINENYNAEAAEILNIMKKCLNHENYDRSDSQTDYFDVGHYVTIVVGTWDKPFQVI